MLQLSLELELLREAELEVSSQLRHFGGKNLVLIFLLDSQSLVVGDDGLLLESCLFK